MRVITNLCNLHSLIQYNLAHPHLSFLKSLNMSFPQIYITESSNRETGRRKFQLYMNELANIILNVDFNSRISKKVLFFFDDKARSLSDKIQIKLLEYRLANTVEYCNFLQKSQHSSSVQSSQAGSSSIHSPANNSQSMSLTHSLSSISTHPHPLLKNPDTPMEQHSILPHEPTTQHHHGIMFANQQRYVSSFMLVTEFANV